MKLSAVSKALAAVSIGVGEMVAQGLIKGAAEHWIVGVIGALVLGIGVYASPKNTG